MRGLGLDGEEPQSPDYIANNLGHSDTTMVNKVYGKLGLRGKLELVKREKARRTA